MANPSSPFKPESPLERIPGESLRANEALRDYVDMGPGRSLRKLLDKYRVQSASGSRAENGDFKNIPAEPPSKPPTIRIATLFNWSRRFGWQERIEVWKRLKDAKENLKWEKRGRKLKEHEWKLSQEIGKNLDSVYKEMLNFHKTKRHVIEETGQEVITVGLNTPAIAKLTELYSKIGRLATGMATERQEHSGVLQIAPPDNYSDLSDEQLEQLIDNLEAAA